MNWLQISSPLLFFLLPLLIGRALLVLVSKLKPAAVTNPADSSTPTEIVISLSRLGMYFSIGSLGLFGLAWVLTQVSLFQPYFWPIVGLIALISVAINSMALPKPTPEQFKSFIGITSLIGVLSAIGYAVWVWHSPYPLNWDLYQHQALATYIQQGSFSFFTSNISDTFGFASYPPLFHLLMAISQSTASFSSEQLLQFWQIISFWHLSLVSLGSFLVGYAVSRRWLVAIVSCLIGTLTFESVVAFTSFFFLPQTLAAVIFSFWYSHLLLIGHHRRKSLKWWLPLVAIISLTLTHYVVGGLASIIYLGSFIFLRFDQIFNRRLVKFAITLTTISLAVAGVVASYGWELGFINRGEASFYSYGFSQVMSFVQQGYGYFLYALLPIGIIGALRAKQGHKYLLLLTAFGLSAIVLSHFPYVLKFLTLDRFFLQTILAFGIVWLLDQIKWRPLQALGLATVTVSLVAILSLNSLYWKQGLFVADQATHVSADDAAAAEFLGQNYAGTEAMIISEPATQFILEGLSGVNSPAGAFATSATRQSVAEAFAATSATKAASLLRQPTDALSTSVSPRLYVISGRLAHWQAADPSNQAAFNFNIWKPAALTLQDHRRAAELVSTDQFRLVYQNPSYLILEIQ